MQPHLYDPPRILPAGDRALVVEFADHVSDPVNDQVVALADAVTELPGVVEAVPTYRSLLVLFDPFTADLDALGSEIRLRAKDATTSRSGGSRELTLPVCYGGAEGEDLAFVAETLGMTDSALIERHRQGAYRCHMIGFQPGFAYLGGLDPALGIGRRQSPRAMVPAGSIAIAGGLACVFSIAAPSGWHLLGRTPVATFDADRDEPFLIRTGDRLRFRPIEKAEYDALVADQGAATAAISIRTLAETLA